MARTRDGKEAPYYPEKIMWSDGSFAMDIPMDRMTELFNVNHFIVSQVNPFSSLTMTDNKVKEWPRLGKLDESLQNVKAGNDWIKLELMRQTGHALNALRQFAGWFNMQLPTQTGLLGQQMYGDITITPRFRWRDLLLILNNSDEATVNQRIVESARAAYPSIERIRLNTMIEYRLEDALRDCLRAAYVDPSRAFAMGLDSKRLLMGGLGGEDGSEDLDPAAANRVPRGWEGKSSL